MATNIVKIVEPSPDKVITLQKNPHVIHIVSRGPQGPSISPGEPEEILFENLPSLP